MNEGPSIIIDIEWVLRTVVTIIIVHAVESSFVERPELRLMCLKSTVRTSDQFCIRQDFYSIANRSLWLLK